LQIDSDVADELANRSLYLGQNGYVYFSTWADGPQTLHAFVMGGARDGMHIDHINGDKLDNRRVNLRFVTPQMNQVNRKRLSRANRSGVRGVASTDASRRNPWRAQITVNRQSIHLGLFPTVELAIEARKAAERAYFGEECP
jgi:HNH endonuclease